MRDDNKKQSPTIAIYAEERHKQDNDVLFNHLHPQTPNY